MSSAVHGDEMHDEVHAAAHVLPAQGPIEVFIHHNTLHAFQALPFHQAVAKAEDQLGVRGYLEEAEFREAYRAGRIGPEHLDWALERRAPTPLPALPVDARALYRAMLFSAPGAMPRDTLEFLKSEGRWATQLDGTVDVSTRARLIAETVTWLDEALRSHPTPHAFARRLVGPRVDVLARHLESRGLTAEAAEAEAIRRVLQPLGLSSEHAELTRALNERAEALTAHALWGACVEAAGGADVLDDAPTDPVGQRAATLLNDFLVPLCAGFVDRGVARWVMPHREKGFFTCFRELHTSPREPLPHWLAGLPAVLRASLRAAQTAEQLLATLPPATRRRDLEALLLGLPGWAGMFQRIEQFPVPELPQVRLVDYLAVRLTLQPFAEAAARSHVEDLEALRPVLIKESVLALWAALQRLGVSAREVSQLSPVARTALIDTVSAFDGRARSVVWQEAYERQHELEVVGALVAHRPPRPPPVTLQAVFCFDDREESYRRHFEEQFPEVKTFGAAGFFGVAVEFLPLDDVTSATQAPVGVNPAHAVHEQSHPDDAAIAQTRKRRRGTFARLSASWRKWTRGAAGGGLASFLAGPVALAELSARVLAPRTTERAIDAVTRALVPDVRTVFSEDRELEETRTIDGRFLGFSAEEKAQRVAATLENIGLTRDFAPLVVFVAHGSSSLNNPHRSAYDCGACGGRNGGPNARLFARMANRPAVREAMARQGIVVPEGTHVLGALHDTATDEVFFYDEHEVPEALRPALEKARAEFNEITQRSAHERCRKFGSAPTQPSLPQALRHVQARAADVSQARPELGHATNAVAVVGRRSLTRGLFLDRRAFLISYDPGIDPAGAILERIVAAAGPVGAGINLEYYFSRVDNERLGCGTKLPHNLVSHVGVMDGAQSDLRTGLPRQMIEIHEPVRLLFIIDAETEIIEGVVARQPQVAELVVNEWVRVVALSPSGRGAFVFREGRFQPWDGVFPELPTVRASIDWYEGHMGFRPPAVIAPKPGVRRVA